MKVGMDVSLEYAYNDLSFSQGTTFVDLGTGKPGGSGEPKSKVTFRGQHRRSWEVREM